ncbi:MAG TPA: guanylate kinase [Candidatus Dormibacteraeota bacterium]|nr:guanylate kinase [Candidatus Dormibacteraeota bacterium]
MSRSGLLLVVSGPGGVGKDTVINKVCELDSNVRYSVSFTTRPRRDYEVDGVHYSFVTRPKFEELIGRGELLEFTRLEANGHYYGTSRTRVEKLQRAGHDVVLKIEVHGAEAIRQQRPDGIFIFLQPPSMEELVRRRMERGSEDPEEMARRQKQAQWEMSHAQYYDYVIVNDDVDVAAQDVLEIVRAERGRRLEPEAAADAD